MNALKDQRQITVLFLAPDVSMDSPTGDSVHVRRLAKLLADNNGAKVWVLCRQSNKEYSDILPVQLRRASRPKHLGWLPNTLSILLLSRRVKFDIVYERGGFINIGVFISKILGIPLIIEADGLEYESYIFSKLPHRIVARTVRVLERNNYSEARSVVVSGEAMRTKLVADFHLLRDKIVLVPTGTDIATGQHAIEPEQDRYAKSDPRLELCFVGSVSDAHGLFTIVEAFEHDPTIREIAKVTIIGEGSHKELLKNRVRKSGLEDSIVFEGGVPHNMIRGYLARCDACLAPQVEAKTGLSIKVLEYMAEGKPIIASRIGDHEIIEANHLGILFEPENPEDLARSIRSFVDHKTQLTMSAKKGLEIVAKDYTWSKTADSVHALMKETLEH